MEATAEQRNNKRIAKNTLLLYFRMLITMAVSLYTSRVILQILGVEDFGIYNVVGGVVGMLSFLTASMSMATQRFISFNLGLNNQDKLRRVFSTSLISHFFLAGLIVIVAETLGLWFLFQKLQIPETRLHAAFWTYQCSVLVAAISIISVPYNAAIVAHEKMKAFAYISIFEVLAKLIVVYSLLLAPIDKLIFYGVLLAFIQICIRCIYTIYCRKNFAETKFVFVKDRKMFKEILSFVGWTIFGQVGCMAATHGENILLNMFFGPIVNAAKGVANQVNFAINSFATNFQMAINPQITKSYAAGDMHKHYSLIYASAKFSCLLLIILSIPILVETEHVLKLWLKIVPANTVTFVRIVLVTAIFDSTANAVAVSAQATGRIKYYQIACGITLLMILPISYVFLKKGFDAKTVLVVHLMVTMLTQCVRVYFLHRLIRFSGWEMVKKVYVPCFLVFVVALLLPVFIATHFPSSNIRFCGNVVVSVLLTSILVLVLGMSRMERLYVHDVLKKIRSKF